MIFAVGDHVAHGILSDLICVCTDVYADMRYDNIKMPQSIGTAA